MLTKDEAELYDRQIRLWGVNAQTKLRQSKVLMLGFNGIASEVAKILVLAGIDTLTIVDNEPLQESDLKSNLFCRTKQKQSDDSPADQSGQDYRTHAVREKLRVLNPLVKVDIINEPITSEKVKTEYIPSHDFVSLHIFLDSQEIISINNKCRSHGVKFYIAIDYGYFGFMFNDLGNEFKFTYEEFESSTQQTAVTTTSNNNNKSNSNEAITVSDGDDDSDNESAADDEKPRKRQRVGSPVRKDDKDKDAKFQKIETLKYCSFEEMLKLENCQFSRRTSPILIVSLAMFKFYDKFRHLPAAKNDDDATTEWTEFDKILDQLKEATQVESNFKRLDPDWRDNIRGSLSPVCAVLGGVAGQDMIRALSTKDIPIFNTFSFDGLNMNGIVEKVGLWNETKAEKVIKPVVRDVIQFDSDDDGVVV